MTGAAAPQRSNGAIGQEAADDTCMVPPRRAQRWKARTISDGRDSGPMGKMFSVLHARSGSIDMRQTCQHAIAVTFAAKYRHIAEQRCQPTTARAPDVHVPSPNRAMHNEHGRDGTGIVPVRQQKLATTARGRAAEEPSGINPAPFAFHARILTVPAVGVPSCARDLPSGGASV